MGNSKGPAEVQNLIKNVGDIIIAVDGVSTINKSFKHIIMMLRKSGEKKFARMRFLSSKFKYCHIELNSMGAVGGYLSEVMHKSFRSERRQFIFRRKDRSGKEEDSDGSVGLIVNSDESDDDASEADFHPDSDDEDLMIREKAREDTRIKRLVRKDVLTASPQEEDLCNTDERLTTIDNDLSITQAKPIIKEGKQAKSNADESIKEENIDEKIKPVEEQPVIKHSNVTSTNTCNSFQSSITPSSSLNVKDEANHGSQKSVSSSNKNVLCQQETTQSLALQLLDIDLGYSSDEAGNEECAYFVDGVDSTFTSMEDAVISDSLRDSSIMKEGNFDKTMTLPT